MNIDDYGMILDYESRAGIPARVTAVHKERYQIVCEYGETYARLKTGSITWTGRPFPLPGTM